MERTMTEPNGKKPDLEESELDEAEKELLEMEEDDEDDEDFPKYTALVVCPECYQDRFYGPVFATDYLGPESEHLINCEYHGNEVRAVVLNVIPLPYALA